MKENLNNNDEKPILTEERMKKKYEPRIPESIDELLVFISDVIDSTKSNGIADEKCIQIVNEMESIRNSLIHERSIQQKLMFDHKNKSSEITKLYDELEDQIRKFGRYLKYLHGPKSNKFVLYGFETRKNNLVIPDTHSDMIAFTVRLEESLKVNNINDQEVIKNANLIKDIANQINLKTPQEKQILKTQKDASEKCSNLFEKLEDIIREFVRYLDYIYGPKSDELSLFNIPVRK